MSTLESHYFVFFLSQLLRLYSKMPEPSRDTKTLEPYVKMDILTPSEYNGVSFSYILCHVNHDTVHHSLELSTLNSSSFYLLYRLLLN